MEGKEFFDAVEFGEATLGKTPEGFDAIDVNATGSEGLGLVDADVFVVADIDQAVIAAPVIGEHDAGRIDLAAQDGVQSAGRAVGHNLGVDAALALVDAEDRLLESTATALAGRRAGPK